MPLANILPSAEADLADIWEYIAQNSPVNADRLIDRIMSAGVPAPRGARMAAYQPTGDQADLADLMAAHARAWQSFDYQGDDDRSALSRKIAERAGAGIGLATTAPLPHPQRFVLFDFDPPPQAPDPQMGIWEPQLLGVWGTRPFAGPSQGFEVQQDQF